MWHVTSGSYKEQDKKITSNEITHHVVKNNQPFLIAFPVVGGFTILGNLIVMLVYADFEVRRT